jgi:hypothetical protein
LNKLADAGGMPNNDPSDPSSHFFKAQNAASLQAALDKIGGVVASCTFQLSKKPSDLDKVFVYLDDAKVQRDTAHGGGWDYDASSNSITFYGSECDKLKNNASADIDVVFGCDQPIPG